MFKCDKQQRNFTLRMQIVALRDAGVHKSALCILTYKWFKCAIMSGNFLDWVWSTTIVMQVSIASLVANLGFLLDSCVVSALVPLLVRMLQILPWWHGWKDSTPLLHTSSSRRKPTDAWRRLSFMNGDWRRLTLSLTTLGRKPPQENYSKNLANMRLPRSLESSMLASNSLTKCRCEHTKK